MATPATKSDVPVEDLDVSQAWQDLRKPKWHGDTPICAMDTETADELVWCITASDERHGDWEVTKPGGIDVADAKGALYGAQQRGKTCVWYNLSFDFEALAKYVLPDAKLHKLARLCEVEHNGFSWFYIRGKFAKISDGSGHTVTHYDASQFFYGGLDKACQEWLGEGKQEGVDTKKFGSSDGRVNQYIADRYAEIMKYARKDATLTRRLFRKFVDVGESIGIPMGKPISTGQLSQQWLQSELQAKPGLPPKRVSAYAWDSYAGGRFEVFKRGDVGAVVGPDINSAYPGVMADLPDPSALVWRKVENPSTDELRACEMGFVRAQWWTDPDAKIQPFRRKRDDGGVFWPVYNGGTQTVIAPIVAFARDNGLIERSEEQTAWLGYSEGSVSRPWDNLPELYRQRKAWEGNGKDKRAKLLKIVMNSLYGKTCQVTERTNEYDSMEPIDTTETFATNTSIWPSEVGKHFTEHLTSTFHAGPLWNPAVASYITGLTRLELHKRVVEYGLEDRLVMMATDCLMLEAGGFEDTSFEADLCNDKLGGWDMDYEGSAWVVGCGMYEIDLGDGKTKVKSRGINPDAWEGKSLKATVNEEAESVTYKDSQPLTLGQATWHNDNLQTIAAFQKVERTLSPNMDTKREWESVDNFGPLLTGLQTSQPIPL